MTSLERRRIPGFRIAGILYSLAIIAGLRLALHFPWYAAVPVSGFLGFVLATPGREFSISPWGLDASIRALCSRSSDPEASEQMARLCVERYEAYVRNCMLCAFALLLFVLFLAYMSIQQQRPRTHRGDRAAVPGLPVAGSGAGSSGAPSGG